MGSRNYRDLIAWQKAMDLVVGVYAATRSMPAAEQFALTNQMRRAAVSVPANIAEGEGRGTPRELAQFLRISHGSLRELETHLMIAQRLDYLPMKVVEQLLLLAGDVGRLIQGFQRSIKA